MSLNKQSFIGILAFLIVLLTMPLGHSAMILMENIFGHEHVYLAAVILGFIGLIFLLIGMITKKQTGATFWGLFGGLFVWTGWIEFAFVYYAHRNGIQPLMENGVIVTKPEYLLMPSSIGFWAVFMIYYFFNSKTGCHFYSWFQEKLKIANFMELKVGSRNVALTTFNEMIIILWTFYLLLLFSYDDHFGGDHSVATYIIAFGSLFWSIYLFFKLLKISDLGYAIRYAIPTVIIFWNFVEILGRWSFFTEIWIHPLDYSLEISIITGIFILLVIVGILSKKKKKKN